MLRTFEQVEAIRNMFFVAGNGPQVAFTVIPEDLDLGAIGFRLQMDGQVVEYRHSAPRPVPMTWPGPKPGEASVTFEVRSGAPGLVTHTGVWAWFKLLDSADVRRITDDRYMLSVEEGGHRADIVLQADSVRNPFGRRQMLQQFRCA
jgi:type VI secretion system protein ImpL